MVQSPILRSSPDNGDMSKAGEKIAGEISKVPTSWLTAWCRPLATAQFGETATQTSQRLNQEVQATNAILFGNGQ